MENKKFNGFASEEQYEAVKSAVNECVGRKEIEVKYDKDTDTIGVDGWFYSFTIAGDTLISIEIDNSDVFDDVTTIYESVADIWEAFVDNQPKEANA